MNIEKMTPEQVRTKAVVDGVTGWTEKRLGEITNGIEKSISDAMESLRGELRRSVDGARSSAERFGGIVKEVTIDGEPIAEAMVKEIEKAKSEIMARVRDSVETGLFDADKRMDAVKELTKTIAALPAPNVNVEAPSVNVDAPQVFIDPRIVDLLDALKRGHEVMQLQMVSLSRQLLESIRRQEEAFTVLVDKLQERNDKAISVQFSDDGKTATVR